MHEHTCLDRHIAVIQKLNTYSGKTDVDLYSAIMQLFAVDISDQMLFRFVGFYGNNLEEVQENLRSSRFITDDTRKLADAILKRHAVALGGRHFGANFSKHWIKHHKEGDINFLTALRGYFNAEVKKVEFDEDKLNVLIEKLNEVTELFHQIDVDNKIKNVVISLLLQVSSVLRNYQYLGPDAVWEILAVGQVRIAQAVESSNAKKVKSTYQKVKDVLTEVGQWVTLTEKAESGISLGHEAFKAL